ncbi:MAG: trigger factor [Bacteroidetes bacterium]|nr:trigger factor [Bacteroidota bacterium]
MEISKKELNALHAVLTVTVSQNDYQEKVDTLLKDYRKRAAIPGFRKGQVPMSLIKKQYEQGIKAEEVNKLLQNTISEYIQKEQLDLLGNVLPKEIDDFDWNHELLNFEFEIGLAPDFEPAFPSKKTLTQYEITVSDKSLKEQVERLRNQYGSLETKSEIAADTEVVTSVTFEEKTNRATFSIKELKGKKNQAAFIGKKVGDTVAISTKGLFEETSALARVLGMAKDQVEKLKTPLEFTLEEVNVRKAAALDQAFFDKLFGPDKVKSEEEMKTRIKEDSEAQFVQQSDQKLMNDVTEKLIEETKFDLPKAFLIRWMQHGGEKPLTEEEAIEEYERTEKGIRYQLIESKLIAQNDIKIAFEDLKEFTKGYVASQMSQFGKMNPTDEELDSISASIMQNEEEVRRLSGQLINERILELFKEKAKLKKKKVTFEEFMKEAYA